MNIAFAYNVKVNDPSADLIKQTDIEFDLPVVIDAIEKTLQELGHSVIKIEANLEAYEKLKENKDKIDIVFNIAEGLGGDARESQIPLFCEMLDIPYTHSSPTVHAIGLNKEFTKLILKSGGIARVPGSQTVNSNDFVLKQELKFPIIVKPNKEGSSKGVLDKNIVSNEKDLRDRVENLLKEIRVEVLIEEYINGREFTVAVLGNNPPKVLPIIEQKFDFLPKGMNRIASYELKWLYEDTLKDLGDAYVCPAKVEEELRKEIEETSIKVFKFLDVKDCARIDYRLNVNNELYFLEINTLPGINPDETVISYFPIASRAIGMKYKDLIESILKEACKRQGIAQ